MVMLHGHVTCVLGSHRILIENVILQPYIRIYSMIKKTQRSHPQSFQMTAVQRFCLVHRQESHRVVTTLGARHDQARIQSVALWLLVVLAKLVHVCPPARNSAVALFNCGFYGNSIVLNRLGGCRRTLDFPTFSVPVV